MASLNSLPPKSSDVLGWQWNPMNGGSPIASGAGPASQVQFGDINGDGKDDYLVVDPVTGELTAYLNGGPSTDSVTFFSARFEFYYSPSSSLGYCGQGKTD